MQTVRVQLLRGSRVTYKYFPCTPQDALFKSPVWRNINAFCSPDKKCRRFGLHCHEQSKYIADCNHEIITRRRSAAARFAQKTCLLERKCKKPLTNVAN